VSTSPAIRLLRLELLDLGLQLPAGRIAPPASSPLRCSTAALRCASADVGLAGPRLRLDAVTLGRTLRDARIVRLGRGARLGKARGLRRDIRHLVGLRLVAVGICRLGGGEILACGLQVEGVVLRDVGVGLGRRHLRPRRLERRVRLGRRGARAERESNRGNHQIFLAHDVTF
jgi:hypothetical protein